MAGTAHTTAQRPLLCPSQPPLHPPPAAFVLDGAADGERGLLMTVLALVHLAGGKLEEGAPGLRLGWAGRAGPSPRGGLQAPSCLLLRIPLTPHSTRTAGGPYSSQPEGLGLRRGGLLVARVAPNTLLPSPPHLYRRAVQPAGGPGAAAAQATA